jgi:hypothetical protein
MATLFTHILQIFKLIPYCILFFRVICKFVSNVVTLIILVFSICGTQVFDKHNRGYISASDLRAVLQCLGEDLSEEESGYSFIQNFADYHIKNTNREILPM